ncbi:single-strand binding protein [Sulfobacillus acidophilus DSM 10332]|uniref:Single-stranded DNA-binding protein n=1 Tax=Sulfobacillus acidophilus (strain ATCC 700253 / DSM 10332 / NAL) TaxID=679936 RepID=G8TUY0_SULAD|nr:single-strand binding protein [Sulfobacillus acidophilus DSM 10332]
MLNRVVLIGRLTRDPEMRYTPQGVPVASFTLAVDRPFSNQQGQRETDFIDCIAWRKLGETVGNHLTKGRLAAVEGRLQIRSYEAQDGTKRRVAEVVCDSVRFLDRPRDAQGGAMESFGADETELPDDLPF